MDLQIREAQLNDAQEIVDIFNPIIKTGRYTTFDTPFTVAAEREYIANMSHRDIFHVAVHLHDRRIVGFQSMSPQLSYSKAFDHIGVLGTFVDLAYHRRGIAKRLFGVTLEAAKKKDYKKIFTYVRVDNPAALITYMKQGFRIIGTAQKHAKIGINYVDEIIIEKIL